MNKQPYPLSQELYLKFREHIKKFSGVSLKSDRRKGFYLRTNSLLKTFKLKNYNEFYDEIISNQSNSLNTALLNCVTIDKTSFFRQPYHFHYLEKKLHNHIIDEIHNSGKYSVLSAGCATGEEAYSIAICLYCSLGPKLAKNISIIAIDINTDSLQFAKQGIYSEIALKTFYQDNFKQQVVMQNSFINIKPHIRRMVSFQPGNLMKKSHKPKQFQLIFCRNVIIYMAKSDQLIVLSHLYDLLVYSGILFSGSAESIQLITDQYVGLHPHVYQKQKEGQSE